MEVSFAEQKILDHPYKLEKMALIPSSILFLSFPGNKMESLLFIRSSPCTGGAERPAGPPAQVGRKRSRVSIGEQVETSVFIWGPGISYCCL